MVTPPSARRRVSHHEAGHAVASHFFPLAGRTTRVTLDPSDLAEYNAPLHPINEAAGLHSASRTIPAIVGRSVDREQLHHELIRLLSGPAADWVFAGDPSRKRELTPQQEADIERHADGTDDYSRALTLLFDADPFDSRAILNRVPSNAPGRVPTESLVERYFRPAHDAHVTQVLAEFGARWREALTFVVEKWPHVQAVADALWRKRVLTGDEVTEIIERVETRTQTLPPHVAEQIEMALRTRGVEGD